MICYRVVKDLCSVFMLRPAEKKDIAIGIRQFEPTQPVLIIAQRLMEFDTCSPVFFVQRIGVFCGNIGIQARPVMPGMVGNRQDIRSDLFEHDGDLIAANDRKEWVFSLRADIADLKSQPVFIKCNGNPQVLNDEQGSYVAKIWH